MLRAVDLDQFAPGFAPQPWLVQHPPVLARQPQSFGNHPFAQGLVRDMDVMQLGQLLGGKGRPKVGKLQSDQVQDLGAPRNTNGIVRRTSACLVGQPGWAIRPKPRQQPKYLPRGQAEQAGGVFDPQATGLHFGQHFDRVQLALAHRQPAHARPPRIMLQPGESDIPALLSSDILALRFVSS